MDCHCLRTGLGVVAIVIAGCTGPAPEAEGNGAVASAVTEPPVKTDSGNAALETPATPTASLASQPPSDRQLVIGSDSSRRVASKPTWARPASSCRGRPSRRLPPVLPDSGAESTRWADYHAERAKHVPGGFGGIFFEYDPPFAAGTTPGPETRRITLMLVDTTKAAAALEALQRELAERNWDEVRPRTVPARWTVPELRAWYLYLARNPDVRQAAAMMLFDARQNSLRFGVWDEKERAELESHLAQLDIPCHLVKLEVATDPTRGDHPLQTGVPAERAGVRYNKYCQVPEHEPASGWRTYDLHVEKRWDEPSRMEEAVRAVDRIGGRVTHRFHVEVVRAELTAAQARFLAYLQADLIQMAVAVRDTQVRNVYVNIRYPNISSPENLDALKALTERPVTRRPRRYVQTIVADSNIPRIRKLPGVASVEVTGIRCG